MIHYLSPFSREKNIGKAYNDAIQIVADSRSEEDWIVLVDQDVLFLRPDSKTQIEDILETTEYDLLGCRTNRLGSKYQIVPYLFHETDILKHIEHANTRHEALYGEVKFITHDIAAMVMCFRISTWMKLKGFTENSIQFDLLFCHAARANKLRLGIMMGVYVFHLYRLGYPEGEARNNYQHLIK